MTEPNTSRREATKARLVSAGIAEFARRGIDATSVEQLCEAAGFTRGAFYSNFDSKDDLCIEITRRIATGTAEALQQALDEMPAAMERGEMVRYLLASRSPSPEVRTTLMEMELRAHRDPAFGVRFQEARSDLWPAHIEMARLAAERAGVDYTIDVRDFMFISEATYYYPGGSDDPERPARLIGLLAEAFSHPKES
ncbi:TetR/AcrR family transcriptional regulator [Tessaracoccus flavus]|uniref:Uncharacterized protein n=1 Tax=Tessaracoccus flavus TaxID=1610493 RepID=A0A1Q2CHU2_9ACTN|nr:hypothetical protein RPIT_13165 [Tessaracoccus flavus]SDY76505.1 transcriptional regulator, TetR family [Tessaracoccus flavus]